MKPNFALNLSHEGISLLHRAKAGWLSVGDVSLDDPSLASELGVLRRTAADLEAGGLTTKLVIPNSQVLYTEVDAPGPTTADRIAQIRDGLVGLTPYDVRDLVFDWRRVGKRAQVAVVARETLQEAESFATQYRFNPVSFVAMPANGAFTGEPFFGPTRHAATILTGGETVQPDAETMQLLRAGEMSAPAPAPPAPDPEPPAPKPKATSKRKAKKPTPEAQADAPPATSPRGNGADPAPPPPQSAADPADPVATPAPLEPAFSHRRSATPAAAAQAAPAAGPKPEPEPPVTFASRRANGRTAPIPPAHTAPAAKAAPPPIPPRRLPPIPEPKVNASAVPEPPAPRAVPPLPERTPLPVTDPGPAGEAPRAKKPKRDLAGPAKSAGTALAGTLGSLGKLRRKSKKPDVDKAAMAKAIAAPHPKPGADPIPDPVPPVPPARPATQPRGKPAPDTEAQAMTVFGARGRAPVRGKPRYLGLILTLILLLALAILALWSTYFMSDVTSGWFGTFEDEPEVAISEPAPQIATAPSPVELATTPLPTQRPAPTDTPASDGTAPEGTEDTATVVPGATPEVAGAAPEAPADQSAIDAAVETALTETPTPEAEAPAVEDDIEIARLEPPQAETALPTETEAPSAVVRRPLTRPEAEARYAATGIWQLDPDPLAVPGSDRIDGLVLATVDPSIGAPGAAVLPSESALDTDRRPDALLPPPSLGTDFDFDERGLVRATSEGAVTPDGIEVFLGAPAYVPGARPADLPIPQDETALQPPAPAQDTATAEPAAEPRAPEAEAEAEAPETATAAPAMVGPVVEGQAPAPAAETETAVALLPQGPLPEAPAAAAPVVAAPEIVGPVIETPVADAPASEPQTPEDSATAETTPETQETEVARLGGFSREELAAIRPAVRPASLWTDPDDNAAAPAADDDTTDAAAIEPDLNNATELAVAASATPAVRPQNFASLVETALEEAARSNPAPEPERETAPTVAAPRAPSIPTRASVANQATERNVLNLSRVNLIGVYGTPSNRSALVRLKSGRFVKVEVGDTVDGGRVAAIGDTELRYVKRGRNITLKLPQG